MAERSLRFAGVSLKPRDSSVTDQVEYVGAGKGFRFSVKPTVLGYRARCIRGSCVVASGAHAETPRRALRSLRLELQVLAEALDQVIGRRRASDP